MGLGFWFRVLGLKAFRADDLSCSRLWKDVAWGSGRETTMASMHTVIYIETRRHARLQVSMEGERERESINKLRIRVKCRGLNNSNGVLAYTLL